MSNDISNDLEKTSMGSARAHCLLTQCLLISTDVVNLPLYFFEQLVKSIDAKIVVTKMNIIENLTFTLPLTSLCFNLLHC